MEKCSRRRKERKDFLEFQNCPSLRPLRLCEIKNKLVLFFLLVLFVLFWPPNSILSQENGNVSQAVGFKLGLIINFGKPVNRIGLVGNAYLYTNYFQYNIELRGYHNFTNFGPPGAHWEWSWTNALLIPFGPQIKEINPFFTAFTHQMPRKSSFGYAYRHYFNKINTGQGVGIVLFQDRNLHLYFENDFLKWNNNRDEFRTGAFGIRLRTNRTMYDLNIITWTGQTKGSKPQKKESYPCRWGYKDCSGLLYSNYAHGIISAGIQHVLPQGQIGQFSIGLDAEQIRNFFQNKLLHDAYFIPKKWIKIKNYHYPMLDEKGNPYLYEKDQQIRKPTLFLRTGFNGEAFY